MKKSHRSFEAKLVIESSQAHPSVARQDCTGVRCDLHHLGLDLSRDTVRSPNDSAILDGRRAFPSRRIDSVRVDAMARHAASASKTMARRRRGGGALVGVRKRLAGPGQSNACPQRWRRFDSRHDSPLDGLARQLPQERPQLKARVASGLVIGLSGVGILVGPARLWGSSRVDILGTAVLMFSAFCWAVGSLYSRGANLPPSPFLAAAMEMLAGGAMLIVLGFLIEGGELHWHAISLRSISGLLYLVVFGSLLGFTAYIWLLQCGSDIACGDLRIRQPAVAVFLGWAFGRETISARELLATAIIIIAVALILFHRPQPLPWLLTREGLPTLEEQHEMEVRK